MVFLPLIGPLLAWGMFVPAISLIGEEKSHIKIHNVGGTSLLLRTLGEKTWAYRAVCQSAPFYAKHSRNAASFFLAFHLNCYE